MFAKTEMPTCTCGREAEWEPQLELRDCDVYGEPSCSDCRHKCEQCGAEGCEQCMTNTVDGWCCSEDCAAKRKEAEDKKDRTWKAVLARIVRARKAG